MAKRLDNDQIRYVRLWNLMKSKGITSATALAKILCRDGYFVHQPDTVRKQIKNHLYDGKCTDTEYIFAYSKFFGCSADYLLGIEKRPTHEKTDIGGYTGLSDESIEKLHEYNTSRFSSERDYIKALDLILSCDNFKGVLERVLDYEKACHDVPVSSQELTDASTQSAARIIQAVASDIDEVTIPYVDVNEKHQQYLNDISRKDALKYGIDTQFRKCLDEIEEKHP